MPAKRNAAIAEALVEAGFPENPATSIMWSSAPSSASRSIIDQCMFDCPQEADSHGRRRTVDHVPVRSQFVRRHHVPSVGKAVDYSNENEHMI